MEAEPEPQASLESEAAAPAAKGAKEAKLPLKKAPVRRFVRTRHGIRVLHGVVALKDEYILKDGKMGRLQLDGAEKKSFFIKVSDLCNDSSFSVDLLADEYCSDAGMLGTFDPSYDEYPYTAEKCEDFLKELRAKITRALANFKKSGANRPDSPRPLPILVPSPTRAPPPLPLIREWR